MSAIWGREENNEMSDGGAFCELNPGCDQKFKDFERRIRDLEDALRGKDGIYATLRRIELDLVRFTSQVRTAVAIGSGLGGFIGAALVSVAIALLK